MYIMKKVFGMNMTNLLMCAAALTLTWYLACRSCSKVSLKEGMQRIGAALDYQMGSGVPGLNVAWDLKKQQSGASLPYRKQQHDTYQGTSVPLKEGQLYMVAGNQFKPSCCGSTFSNSSGCMCATKAQMDYVNSRGGNRSCGCGEF